MVPIAHHAPRVTVPRANAVHARMPSAARAAIATVRKVNATSAVTATVRKVNATSAVTATVRRANAASAAMATVRRANAASAVRVTVRRANALLARMATAHKANAARALKVALAPTVTTHRAPTNCSATITTRYNKNGYCSNKKRCVVRVGNPKSTELAPATASMVGIISTLELSTVVKAPALLARRRAGKPNPPGASRRRKSKTLSKSLLTIRILYGTQDQIPLSRAPAVNWLCQ